jgi:lipoyl(octanoyl) transferase
MERIEREQSAAVHGKPTHPVEWAVSPGLVDYADAVRAMDARVAAIASGAAAERIWLLEHPPLYTAGTSARMSDVLNPDRFPVFPSGRGGQITYHGPGQRVVYLMLDVRRRFDSDVRAFVRALEEAAILALWEFGVSGERRDGRVGIWVRRADLAADREDKIAAVGVRIRRGISLHGLSLNVSPDLSHYDGIVPCGIRDHGVTSLSDLGRAAPIDKVDDALRRAFQTILDQTVVDAGSY